MELFDSPWTPASGGIALSSQAEEGCCECTGGQVCGFNSPGICGGCMRIPEATQCPPNSCGVVSDGCGGTYNCGLCPSGSCGGGGPNTCGENACTPLTQMQACAMATPMKNCGNIGDRCGGRLSCGQCPVGHTCGAAGPNKCGPGQTCTARTCLAANATCGLIGDGCGNAIDCGPCTSPQTCGGAGTLNQCGTGTTGCNKLTCDAQQVECGAASDGCGGLLDRGFGLLLRRQ